MPGQEKSAGIPSIHRHAVGNPKPQHRNSDLLCVTITGAPPPKNDIKKPTFKENARSDPFALPFALTAQFDVTVVLNTITVFA